MKYLLKCNLWSGNGYLQAKVERLLAHWAHFMKNVIARSSYFALFFALLAIEKSPYLLFPQTGTT
ncbi:hypothetical protein ASPBRDRAFT_614569 [Aspergillus brasiliensis CBS 101740]|uniref:Uncharacterized protein n=1 Tax=Aspergillus brasiliensis (strain CBS 101740 / IMI 381727 / IBT 21946) TaxID=767769 RepID=A0A1L9UIV1_ASPBC|nr:hypothetical protein ASPBRDRAFT_614569 [Aspergillus brasiliensis CBS 101740]